MNTNNYNMPGFVGENCLYSSNRNGSAVFLDKSDTWAIQPAISLGTWKKLWEGFGWPIGPEHPKPTYIVPKFPSGCDQCCVQQLEASCHQQCPPHSIDCLPMCIIMGIRQCGPSCRL